MRSFSQRTYARPSLHPLAAALALALAIEAFPGHATTTAPDAVATTRVVTSCNDGGAGSLRQIIQNVAVDGDTIDMTALTCSTITLTSGAIFVTQSGLSLVGPGADHLVIDAYHHSRAFVHLDYGSLTLRDVAVFNGKVTPADDSSSAGGCIESLGTVILDHASVKYCDLVGSGQRTVVGGGVYAKHGAILINSTVSGNTVYGYGVNAGRGGGVYCIGLLVVTYSNIENNSAGGDEIGYALGGGLANVDGSVTILNSTIANNTAGGMGGVMHYDTDPAFAVFVQSSTISGNEALETHCGAGIGGVTEGGFTLANSTVTGNIEGNGANFKYGAGLCAGGSSTATLISSVISGNFIDDSVQGLLPSDVGGRADNPFSGHHNMIAFATRPAPPDTVGYLGEPNLGPLAFNGGTTKTHAPLFSSLALGRGDADGELTDQRGPGFPRVLGESPDIGAVESEIIFVSGFEPGGL